MSEIPSWTFLFSFSVSPKLVAARKGAFQRGREHFRLSRGIASIGALSSSRSSSTWSVAHTIHVCGQLFRAGVTEPRKTLVSVFADKGILQGFWIIGQTYSSAAPPSIIDNAWRLVISKKMASHGVYCAIVSMVIFYVHEALSIELESLEVYPLCTTFMPDLWEHHSFWRWVCVMVIDGFVLNVMS